MFNPRGSVWRKWDLHVHTPDSLVQHYGAASSDVWAKYIEALSQLPADIKVLGINDYIFLDGYKKVLAAKAAGKLPNIDLLLPVIELRLDKFGGSRSSLSRVNYHVIFSNDVSSDAIEHQFLAALSSKYVLSPEYDGFRTSRKWIAVPTRESLRDLGTMIIDSVPEARKADFGPPILEGFNNLCFGLEAIQEILSSHYFSGKTITAVGKTEWADIKWNDQSIADKKTIINSADVVFSSSKTPEDWLKAQAALARDDVNSRLLDCSDAHYFTESAEKDRLGKCFTWIKADPTFEGLRQAIFEYPTRIQVSANPPIEPVLQLKKVRLSFPPETKLRRDNREDTFCFRGDNEISFSPYLTCIIGGRGTGKSTLLHLLHEKLNPNQNVFFKTNAITPNSQSVGNGVSIDGLAEERMVEFLQQNEIEQFASDADKLTAAVFARLQKLDKDGVLKSRELAIQAAITATKAHVANVRTIFESGRRLADAERSLLTQQGIVDSFQSVEYTEINDDLTKLSRDLQSLRSSKTRFTAVVSELSGVVAKYAGIENQVADQPNAYDQETANLLASVTKNLNALENLPSLKAARDLEQHLTDQVAALRDRLQEYLKSRGLSAENLSDVGRAAEKIAELEAEIQLLKSRIEGLRLEISLFQSFREAANDYAVSIESLLAPINEVLAAQSDEVKPIELRYHFDSAMLRDRMIQYVSEQIAKRDDRPPRRDVIESRFADFEWESLPPQNEAVQKIPEDKSAASKNIREFLEQEEEFECLRLQIELELLDVQKRGRIFVLYDGKPVGSLSFGQRCTAVIVVLLLLGNTPIVIDEPEAHLDSSLIAKYLAGLIKARKLHRQIIFATHNANFVINGDAELIHALSMDDTKSTRVVSTTIENLEHRHLLLALEGGKKAFYQREKRYRAE